MTKLTKEDLMNNKQNCILIPMYTFILCVVYGYWLYCKDSYLWAIIVVPIVIAIGGAICTYLSVLKVAKRRTETERLNKEAKEALGK